MGQYHRVLIKLSGEALADKEDRLILGADNLGIVAESIKKITQEKVQVGVVIGAGNIWRGKSASKIGIDKATADYMGMLGTIINALALQSALENIGVPTRVLSAVEVKSVAEPYIRRRAIRHLEKGRVVIFAGGTGNPYFTTDTTASLRAMEIEADVIFIAKNGVDGVYTADPTVNHDATLIKEITYEEMLRRNLKVMDLTAISLIHDKDIEIRVFDMNDPENFLRALHGEAIGSIIRKG
ncbi:MAG: UMP kinase [Bacilli bacterium]|jgi:uridylate kinase